MDGLDSLLCALFQTHQSLYGCLFDRGTDLEKACFTACAVGVDGTFYSAILCHPLNSYSSKAFFLLPPFVFSLIVEL